MPTREWRCIRCRRVLGRIGGGGNLDVELTAAGYERIAYAAELDDSGRVATVRRA